MKFRRIARSGSRLHVQSMRTGSIPARLSYDLGHGARLVVAHCLKSHDDAGAVRGVAVLARFPFAADVEDLDLDPNNRPALHGDEISRRVADRPGRFATRFERL